MIRKPTLLVGAFVAILTAASTPFAVADSGRALAPDHPLQRHRERAAGRQRAAGVVEGEVRGTTRDGRLSTNLTPEQLAAEGMAEGALVVIHVRGRRLQARIIGEASYAELMRAPEEHASLDVDVLAIVDERTVTIAGLAANLGPWLQARRGSRITVVVP